MILKTVRADNIERNRVAGASEVTSGSLLSEVL